MLKKASLGLVVVKEVHRVITYDKKSCLKPYTDMKTEVNKKERNDFEKKIFWSLWAIQFSEKLWKMFENIGI